MRLEDETGKMGIGMTHLRDTVGVVGLRRPGISVFETREELLKVRTAVPPVPPKQMPVTLTGPASLVHAKSLTTKVGDLCQFRCKTRGCGQRFMNFPQFR